MARPLRIEYPGAWYHVMNRGRRKEEIFFGNKDHELFMTILGECSQLFSLEIHAYSLMPNHYHLLVRTPKGNLSRAMRHLNGVYTQRINSRHKFEGSLFKGRFKSILIEEESYFLELLRYIHRNPLKAKIVNDMLEHKWTSHRAYMRDSECPGWLITNVALLKFSKYSNKAKREMDAFVKKSVSKDLEKILDRIRWPVMLGGKQFEKKIKNMIKGKPIDEREVPQQKEVKREYTAKEAAVKIIEELVWDKDVFTRQRIREDTNKKRAFVYVCRTYLQIPCSDIREVLGDISYAAVTKHYKQSRIETKTKEGCYKEVKEISKALK
jgi:REP-associated tyrosine transposase